MKIRRVATHHFIATDGLRHMLLISRHLSGGYEEKRDFEMKWGAEVSSLGTPSDT